MLLLAFSATLLVAVLVSSLAHRTILSTAVLFLAAGFVLGDGATGVLTLAPDDPIVSVLAELALFAVLFTDGMRVGWRDLTSAWRLPGRALALGLPLTLLATAALAHWVVGLDWTQSLLVGAVLSPTDPVFAAALVGNEKVPGRLRHLLNVESGVNDGLALPFVIVLLAVADKSGDLHAGELSFELALGIAIGVVVPLVAIWLEKLPFLAASVRYEALNAVAIGLLVLALAQYTHANLFLAAFAAGITVATYGHQQRESFEEFGELAAELLKLAALLVFGTLITPSLLADLHWSGWIFAVLALFLARPLALAIAFLGSRLRAREQAAAMWFGPKGFASVVYALLVLESGIEDAEFLFHLFAATVALSIVLHSSTDVVVARGFDDDSETPTWHGRLQRVRARVGGRTRE